MDPKWPDEVVAVVHDVVEKMQGHMEESLVETVSASVKKDLIEHFKKSDDKDNKEKARRDRWKTNIEDCVADFDKVETKEAEHKKSIPTYIDAVKTTMFVSVFAGFVTILINNESAIIYWILQLLLQIVIYAIIHHEYTSYTSLKETCNRLKKLKEDQNEFFDNAKSVLVDMRYVSEDILGEELLQKIEKFEKSTIDRNPVKTVRWTTWASWTYSALFSVAVPVFLSLCMGQIDKGAKEIFLRHIKGGS